MLRMRTNMEQDSVCCECGNSWHNSLEMFDICIGDYVFTICDRCNDLLFKKTLKASCSVNSKLKKKEDMEIIMRRKEENNADIDAVDFDCMPCKYWDEHVKISYLQRRVIVYSIMYYNLDESCITDRKYDAISRQLVKMQNSADKEELEKTEYYYAMHDFEGSTGFDIISRLTKKDLEYLSDIAQFVLERWREHEEI